MSAQLQRLLGREVRYQIVDAKSIEVTVEARSGCECNQSRTDLIDISQRGVRLRSESPITIGDFLTITVSFKGPNGLSNPLVVCGQVCWATPARNRRSYFGCSIEPAIPDVLLETLSTSGVLERRSDARQETSISLPAKWECDQNEVMASVLNISDNGMCLLMPQMRSVGDRIRLSLFDDHENATYLFATVCWQIDTEQGHVLGCDFDDRPALLRLKRVADLQAAEAAAGSPLVASEPFYGATADK